MTAVASTSVDPLAPATLGANAAMLLQRDAWSREELVAYQRERLGGLIRHAVERSPYYRAALGPGAERAELWDLPTLPKRVLMVGDTLGVGLGEADADPVREGVAVHPGRDIPRA